MDSVDFTTQNISSLRFNSIQSPQGSSYISFNSSNDLVPFLLSSITISWKYKKDNPIIGNEDNFFNFSNFLNVHYSNTAVKCAILEQCLDYKT